MSAVRSDASRARVRLGIGVPNGVAQLVELDREQRQLLAHVVVQFARDPHALHFLGADETAREVTYPLVAGVELGFAFQEALLGSPSFVALQEQPGDEKGLHEQQRCRADDI